MQSCHILNLGITKNLHKHYAEKFHPVLEIMRTFFQGEQWCIFRLSITDEDQLEDILKNINKGFKTKKM